MRDRALNALLASLFGVAAAALAPAAVAGQADSAAADPDTTAATDTAAIPVAPIRVTVLRVPLPLTETPYAVTVETPDDAGPGLTLAGSLGGVPGLQVDNRYNFSQGDRISVRGFGARAQFGVRGVKVLVDGIPATLPDGQTALSHVDPQRIARAEVVRGPASSAWGNAAGGVIRLETRRLGAAGGVGGGVVVGSHGLRRYEVEAAISSSDHVGADVVASRLLYDGFRPHAAADKRFASARAAWRGQRDALRLVAHGVAYEADNPGSLSADLLAEDRTQAYAFNVVQDAGEAAEQAQVGVTWTHAFGSQLGAGAGPGADTPEGADRPTTLELTGWALSRDLDNPIPPVVIDLGRRAAGVRASLEGAGSLGDRTVTWVAGADAGGQWDDRENWENDAGDRGALVLDQAERVTSLSPFVQASVPVAGPVSALAGLRYDRFRFTVDDRIVEAGDPATNDSGTRTMDQLSPSLGLTAEVGPGSVYATVASSFETPTTTELVNRPGGGAGFNPELEPQRARSLELGARARVGRARVHVAAYRTAIRDALIPFEDPSSPGRTFFRNAGSAVHRGIELDAWTTLGAGLVTRLGWTWIDARFTDFVTPDGDVSGNRVPGVAPHRVTGMLTWTGGGGRVTAEGRWVDAVPVNDANDAVAKSYMLLNLRAASPALPLAGASVELYGGVDNGLDTDYVTSVVVNAFGGRYYEPGPGRAAYLGVRVRP